MKKYLISIMIGACLMGCSSQQQNSTHVQHKLSSKSITKSKLAEPSKPIPKFTFKTPNIYTSTVTDKVIKVSNTARIVLFNTNNSESTSPTEQVYMVDSKTDKWEVIYTKNLTTLQKELLENTDSAELDPNIFVVASMWDAGTGGSNGFSETLVLNTKQNKVLYEKTYEHATLNPKLFTLKSNQSNDIIQQYATSPTPIPKQSVAVLGATSGNVLYIYKNKIQDVEFNNQNEIEKLSLPANSYVTITPSDDLTKLAEIQGNYENLTYGNYSSPTILTIKAGTILVFNNINQDQYSVYTNMWNQGQVNTTEADMINGGVTPKLQAGLFTFLLVPNNSVGNQGVSLQVHVTQ